MFDLVLDKVERPYRKSSAGVTIASIIGHVVLIAVVLVLPVMWATDALPETPDIIAFVVPTAVPPPPPPPPPPPAARAEAPKVVETPVPANPNAAPIEAPKDITPEPIAVETTSPGAGVAGGVEGGIEGGVPGGVIGGLPAAGLPPPPPPPPKQPVRIGGQVAAPALVHRVEPEYPAVAVAAQLEGMVILEATIDAKGRVASVRVLRSRGFLDKAAIEAVKQWRYQPLMLNGQATPFVLTVTLNFALKRDGTLEVN